LDVLYNFFCAAGIECSFITFNETDYYKPITNSGGWPKCPSSYIVPSTDFKGAKVAFEKGTDWDSTSKLLTKSGLAKFSQASNFKGGIFTVGTAAQGHIGMIYYLELRDIKDKKGNILGQQGYYHTLEFNTSARGVSSTGGQLAFNRRLMGGDWGKRCGNDIKPVWFGDSSPYGGGAWAPNGLGNSNTYSWGESIAFSKTI
jgi:hypothetical protein